MAEDYEPGAAAEARRDCVDQLRQCRTFDEAEVADAYAPGAAAEARRDCVRKCYTACSAACADHKGPTPGDVERGASGDAERCTQT